MKKKAVCKLITAIATVSLMMTMLGGCGEDKNGQESSNSGLSSETIGSIEADKSSDSGEKTDARSGRQDGERFEGTILSEGVEETVKYEHAISESVGFEMDFDYESFMRVKGSDRERFVSVYDAGNDPMNYLDVSYSSKSADDAVAFLVEKLSASYEVVKDSWALAGAGSCTRIEATTSKNGSNDLQTLYVIPAADGCRIAAAHFTLESAEGFGRRMADLVNTLTVIAKKGQAKLTDDEVRSAIKKYCYLSNPSLEGIVNAGEYPVYWEVSSSSDNEIVILYGSYTGVIVRYYVDPESGETYSTEFVPGITEEEERTDESLNVKDYLF